MITYFKVLSEYKLLCYIILHEHPSQSPLVRGELTPPLREKTRANSHPYKTGTRKDLLYFIIIPVSRA